MPDATLNPDRLGSGQGDLGVLAHLDEEPLTADAMNGADLVAESGVNMWYSTSETAEFFDRSSQWLYWGLREGVFTDDDGVPLTPERIGNPNRGRRRFTLPLIRNIMRSSYRRGNITPEHLKTVTRRIKLTEEGIEWREREGWRYAHLGRNRWRWIRPEDAYYHSGHHEWRLRKPSDDDDE